MNKNNKVFSKIKAPDHPSLAMCYIEELVNEPETKMYRYYYWDRRNNYYSERTLIMDEAKLVNHLMYNHPEQLQQLLNENRLYRFVMRAVRKYDKAVEQQTEALCKADKEMELARRTGDDDRYTALERNNRSRAEEMLRPLLYGAA